MTAYWVRLNENHTPAEEVLLLEDDQVFIRSPIDAYSNTWSSTWTRTTARLHFKTYGRRLSGKEPIAGLLRPVLDDQGFFVNHRRLFSTGTTVLTQLSRDVNDTSFYSNWRSGDLNTDTFSLYGTTINSAPSAFDSFDAAWAAPSYSVTGTLVGWTERFYKGDTSYYHVSNNAEGTDWPNNIQTETLAARWGGDTNAPPTTGISAAQARPVFDNAGTRVAVREIVFAGNQRYTRDSTDANGRSWPSSWTVESCADLWSGDTDAPPVDCAPLANPPACPPDPDSHLTGTTCLSVPDPLNYITFDNDHTSTWSSDRAFGTNPPFTSLPARDHYPVTVAPGQVGQAATDSIVGGSSGYTAGNSTFAGARTIAFWTQQPAYATRTGNAVYQYAVPAGYQLTISFPTTGEAECSAPKRSRTVKSSVAIIPDQWTHVSCVWDNVAEELRLYVDGLPDGVTDVGNSTLGTGDSGVGMMDNFVGTLDEIAMYDRAISTDDIYRIYLYGLDGRRVTNVTGWETPINIGVDHVLPWDE